MIFVISSVFILLLVKGKNDENFFNLFSNKNKLKALIIFTLEGIFYITIALTKLNQGCKLFFIDVLLFMGVYSIILGLSLYLMRLTNIITYSILFYSIMTVLISTIYVSMKFSVNENFSDKCYINQDNKDEDCITIPQYKNKCLTKDFILNNDFDRSKVELNNIKQKLINEKKLKEIQEKEKEEKTKELYKKKCTNILNLNKECNEECKKGNKYLCNKYLSSSNNYLVDKTIDCSEFDIEGYMIKTCKPYDKKNEDTECMNNFYYNPKYFNKNNLLMNGEVECNKKGLGVKNFKSCPYDDTQVLFECDKGYSNGEPIENNKILKFINKY